MRWWGALFVCSCCDLRKAAVHKNKNHGLGIGTMASRIILAKYAPDLSRMEPRNIGVFLWSKGAICSRFLEADDVDFVNDHKTYDRWKAYWSSLIGGNEIRPRRGKPVAINDETCVDALLSTQEGNYILVDAGEMLEAIGKREIDKATEFLFQELVAVPERASHETGVTLKSQCEKILESTGVTDREDFRKYFPVSCAIFGQKRLIHFSYGFGNGKPHALIQRVDLTKELSVNNAAMTLHTVSDQTIVDKDRCAAFVQTGNGTSKAVQDGYEWLSRLCTLIDVDDPSAPGAVLRLVVI